MDKIRIDIFDILGYLVPGSVLLMALWVAADPSVKSIWQIHESIHRADKKTIVAAILISYIAGFVLHVFGRFIMNILYYDRSWNYRNHNWPFSFSTSEAWALIREHGEKHISILERWYALRALAENLGATSFISIAICLCKWANYGYYEWGFAALSLAILGVILIWRSALFYSWLIMDIKSIIKTLKLDSK